MMPFTWTEDISPWQQTLSSEYVVKAAAFAAVLSLIFYFALNYFWARQAEASFAKTHGCGDPIPLKYKWPLGLDLLVEAFGHARAQQILQFFLIVVERTGPTFEQNLLGAKGIDTVDPKNIETVLSTKFTDYGLGERRQTFFPLLGDGIFTQDAESWKHSRELLRPLFLLNRAHIFSQVIAHADRLVRCIPENEYVDLQPLFFRFTLDTTTFLLFGRSINSLESATPQEAEFAEAFRISQDFLAKRGRLGAYYYLIGGKKFRDNCAIVHRWIDASIQDALSSESQKEKVEEAHCFLDALMQETRDPLVLRDQLLNVLLAGRDTTACCLTWTFRLLAQHPRVYKKLRDEIDVIVGTGNEARLPERNDLKKMSYLSLVLKEVLRLYPSVPINSRAALKATTLPTGGGKSGTQPIMVRKGSAVGYCVYAMHRRKELYGEDADEFRPERWDPNENNVVDLKNIGYGYLPFNNGPRICLGQEFALLEASYVIVRMIQNFQSFELEADQRIIAPGKEKQEVTLVLMSTDGCKIKAIA